MINRFYVRNTKHCTFRSYCSWNSCSSVAERNFLSTSVSRVLSQNEIVIILAGVCKARHVMKFQKLATVSILYRNMSYILLLPWRSILYMRKWSASERFIFSMTFYFLWKMAYPSDILIDKLENFKMLNFFKPEVHNRGPVHCVTISQERA